jgi:hypothetical protein
LARFLLSQGIGTLSPQALFGGWRTDLQGCGHPIEMAPNQPQDLPFLDQQGAGSLRLGYPTIVYRYAPHLQQLVEWRRWLPCLTLDGLVSTSLVPWDDGWLCLLYPRTETRQRRAPHRFVAFSDRLAPIATTLPFALPGRGRPRAVGLSLSEDGDELLVSFHSLASSGLSVAGLSVEQIRACLMPCPESQLDLPGGPALRLLRKAGFGSDLA